MYHSHFHIGISSGQNRIQSGKIIFYVGIFLIPRRLAAYGSRVIPFCLSSHRSPCKMMGAACYAQRPLPVSSHLMPPEIKIPIGNSVNFAGHSRRIKLVYGALHLFGRGKLPPVAENIHAGNPEGTVRAHGLPKRHRLPFQIRLPHHMACQKDIVFLAPASNLVRVAFRKPPANMVVIAVAVNGYPIVRKFPENLRQIIQKTFPVSFPVGFLKIIRVRDCLELFFFRIPKLRFESELRFVGKNHGNAFPERIPQLPFIRFIGNIDKRADCRGI